VLQKRSQMAHSAVRMPAHVYLGSREASFVAIISYFRYICLNTSLPAAQGAVPHVAVTTLPGRGHS
jgi:hypothetical protein